MLKMTRTRYIVRKGQKRKHVEAKTAHAAVNKSFRPLNGLHWEAIDYDGEHCCICARRAPAKGSFMVLQGSTRFVCARRACKIGARLLGAETCVNFGFADLFLDTGKKRYFLGRWVLEDNG